MGDSRVNRPSPLGGLRVVDLTHVLAGPYCTYQLALLGAEVIKVEAPGGELVRHGGASPDLAEQGLGLTFCVQNSDKQFFEIDLKDPAGVEAVLELVAGADVFVQNFRPGVAERLGLGVAAAQARNPTLVYCSISAYGSGGPLGGRPAYDHVVQAMSGIMETTGFADEGPLKVGAPYVDYATGLNAAFAILAALRERDRTGAPQVVDVSMLDTALNLMASNVSQVATTGVDVPKLGNEAASRAPSSGFFADSSGGYLVLAANTQRQFENLCTAIGHPEWADDRRWSDHVSRQENQAALRAGLERVFATDSAQAWEERLARHGVPASRVRKLSDVIGEGQPAARGLLHTVDVGKDNVPVQVPGIGFQLNGHSLGPTRPPQPVGHDNARGPVSG